MVSTKLCLQSSLINEWKTKVINNASGVFKSIGPPVPDGTCVAVGKTLRVPVNGTVLEDKAGVLKFKFISNINITITILYGEYHA